MTCFLSFLLFSWSLKTFKPDTSDPFIPKTRCAQLERGKGGTESKPSIEKRAKRTSGPKVCLFCPLPDLCLLPIPKLASAFHLKRRPVQFSSVAQSCPTFCDPMNRSMPGLPVHHQLPEFTQTGVHRVRDIIQPSHPLSSPSAPAPNPSQHQSLFQ